MIAIGSDHGGFLLKEAIKKHLQLQKIDYMDFGTDSEASCDYPDIAEAACAAILLDKCEKGLLFCGTGVGISIAANKCRGIRAACCSDYFSAKYSRLHNDANVLCLGGRVVGEGLACELVDVFLNTPFEGGGRHSCRIDKIKAIEDLG
jgi:ribose 5-phosphate isomerase B